MGEEKVLLLGKCVNGEVRKDYLDEIRLAINDKTIWTSLGSGKMTVTIGAGKSKVDRIIRNGSVLLTSSFMLENAQVRIRLCVKI